jgi:ABC-type multidrug transport system fused ATPase/permease subunit
MRLSPLLDDLRTVISAAGKPSQRLMLLSVALNIITACFDAIGVGAVVPFVALISMPDLFVRYPVLSDWVPQGLQHDRAALVVAAAGLFALIYLLRAASSLASAMVVARLQGALARDVCRVLFVSYIRQPWAYHLEKGPAYFTTRLSPSVDMANGTVQGMLQFGVEALTAALVFLVVVWANPLAALISVLVLGLPAAFIYHLIRGKARRLGRETQDIAERGIKVMLSGIGGIKELKVLGREHHFQKQYWELQDRWGHLIGRYSLYRSAPRAILELGAVAAVLAMCVVLATQGRIDHLVPVLGLYAAAAFRLLPAVYQLLSSLTMIQRNRSGLAMVADDIRIMPPPETEQTITHGPIGKKPLHRIEMEDVCFSYRPELPLVLDRINLTIHAGETIGVVGSTGAGKSTLVDLLLGLLAPSSGRILVDGQDIIENLRGWQKRIGHVPQVIYLVDDTIRRNVCLGLADDAIDEDQVWQALSAAQLAGFVRSLPEGLDTVVGERGVKISGGQRQRIGIARALYHEPEVLVLDEATSALDNTTEADFMRAIDRLRGQKTIILVAHRLTTLQKCDRIVAIENGRTVEIGTYDALLAKTRHLGLKIYSDNDQRQQAG